eukprot:g6964.t1
MPKISDFPYSDAQVLDLAKQFPTPFHLYHEETIRKTVRGLNEAFSWCPGYKNHFAVKATPNPHIMQVLKEEGCGADCSSMAELVLSERMGLKGEDIMFTSNNTPLKEYQMLAGLELGVKRFGLHAMVVSNCLKVEELLETARMLFNLVLIMKDQLGITIELVNLGGGFGIPYRPDEKVIDVQAVGSGIHQIYKDMIQAKGLQVRIVTECGRYITGPAGLLISRVTHRKKIYKNYVGLDACMANLMRPGMYNAYHHITIVPNGEQVPGLPDRNQEMPDNSKDLISKTGIYDVVGGLCENNDKFAVDRALNADPRPGDVAVIHDSGAHGHSMGFNYNGKPRSAEYLYRCDGSVLRIRRAETLEASCIPAKQIQA